VGNSDFRKKFTLADVTHLFIEAHRHDSRVQNDPRVSFRAGDPFRLINEHPPQALSLNFRNYGHGTKPHDLLVDGMQNDATDNFGILGGNQQDIL
jgi:hypothetical protein